METLRCCATGIFLDGMRRRGWRVQGVELSSEAALYARNRFGLEVFAGELEEAGFPDGTFDVVTLWDVNDRSTAGFMKRFYQRLQEGSDRARALQQAMIDSRAIDPHPYHWAPFVLVGQSR